MHPLADNIKRLKENGVFDAVIACREIEQRLKGCVTGPLTFWEPWDKTLETLFDARYEVRIKPQSLMHPISSTKIPFRDIKDHADLMDAFESLSRYVATEVMYEWDYHNEIKHLKSEIAHFLRAQSAAAGIAVESTHDVFEHGSEKGARKNS